MTCPTPRFSNGRGNIGAFLALLIGFGTIALKWAGVTSSDSVVARSIGVHPALVLGAGIIVAYLIFVQLMMGALARRGMATQDAVIVAAVADMVLLFSVVYTITPPAEYTRALIVAIFPVQFTQLYFGQRATVYNLACVALFYTMIVLAASERGMLPGTSERFWDLTLFLVGTLLFVLLQGNIGQRLQRIVYVFEKAQEGDFSLHYDESLDRMLRRDHGHRPRVQQDARTPSRRSCFTDPLSGCFNRRGFDQLATREVSRAVRRAASRCRSSRSTWTTSRGSTTNTATSPATKCCARWDCCCARPRALATWSRAMAVVRSSRDPGARHEP